VESDEGPRGIAETIDNARLKVSCGRSRRAISGLGLVWIGLQCSGEATKRSERKTGNEYERRYFRKDLATVRAHHDRRCSRTKGMSLTLQKRKRKKERETRVTPVRFPPMRILWDSTLFFDFDIIFLSRPQSRLIFHDSVVSYTVSTIAVISIY